MSTIPNINSAYGLSQALLNIFPSPIVSSRAPTTNDKAQLGTVWVNKVANAAFILTSVVNNVSTWEGVGGGGGAFTALTVTPGPISLTGTTNINAAGAADTNVGGGSGIVTVGGTGDVFIGPDTAASVFIGATSSTTVVNGATTNIGTAPADGAITLGNNTDAVTINATAIVTGSVEATDEVTAGTGIVTTLGDIVASAGNLLGVQLHLAGPIQIKTGAGAPAGGLAIEVGDVYINTTASTISTRIYIATAPGTWTNIVCAA